jgi:predicted ATPase
MKRELSAFFQEVSRLRPLVVFFDDLQWADVSTIDMLAYLAGKFDSLRALIVVTYRPSDLALAKHPFLQIRPNLLAHGLCREMQLDFLTLPDIERYLALEFPGQWFPPEFAALVLARTEGNALFMADLARYLRDRKVIVEERGQWTLTHTLADIERELPESVRGMIQRKIDQLEEADRQLLVAASVEGPEFNSAVLSKAMGVDPAEVEDRLEQLDRAHALVRLIGEEELPDRTLTLRYRFVHLLYQNALYGSLRPTRRASLSAAVARALEGFYGQQGHKVASRLAFLFASARDFPKASSYFFLAARNAAQVFAHREAVTLARRGLDLLKSVSESGERSQQELKLEITLGVSLMASKGYAAPEVEKAYLRARQLCLELGETKRLFPVLWSLWVFYLVGAKFDKAREIAEELQGPAERSQDPAVLAQAYHAMGTTLGYQGELAAARSYFERGIAVYDPRRHRSATFLYLLDPAVGCRCLLARALWLEGRPEEAVEKVQEALTIGESLAHPQSLAYALVVGSMTLQLHHQVARAQRQAEAGSALAREHDLPQVEPWGTIVLGWTLVEQGRHQEGIAQMQDSLKMQRAIGSELDRPYCLALLAEALAKAGQVEGGLTALAEALEAAQSTGERYYEAELHRLQGELLLDQGAGRAEAKACFARALEMARRQGARSLELRAAASLARMGDPQVR